MKAIVKSVLDVSQILKVSSLTAQEEIDKLKSKYSNKELSPLTESVKVVLEPNLDELKEFHKEVAGKIFTIKGGSRGNFMVGNQLEDCYKVEISWEEDKNDECPEAGSKIYTMKNVFDNIVNNEVWILTDKK